LLGPYEIIFLGIIILIIFGPKKLPELAQALGKAVNEYRKASEGIFSTPHQLASSVQASLTQPSSPKSVGPEAAPAASKPAGTLVELAKQLNIETAGKTYEEISAEILKRVRGEEVTKAPTASPASP